MKAITLELHSSHLKRALDVRQHELRALLALEPLASREKARRYATAYTTFDVLFLAVAKRLFEAGFAPKAMQKFSASVYKSLQHMPGKNEPDELRLYLKDGAGWKVGPAPEGSDALTLTIPLKEIRQQLLQFTGAHLIAPNQKQREMVFLTPVQNKAPRNAGGISRKRSAAR